jgi:hypothetical protein
VKQLEQALDRGAPGILGRLSQGMRTYQGNQQCLIDAWYYLQYQLGPQGAGTPLAKAGSPGAWERVYDAGTGPEEGIRTGVRDAFVREGGQWHVQIKDGQGNPIPGERRALPVFSVLRIAEEHGSRNGKPGFTNLHTVVWLGGKDGHFICGLTSGGGKHLKQIAGGPGGPPRFYGKSARIFKVVEIYHLPAHAPVERKAGR